MVQVVTILPRLVETLFSARPYVTVKDREPNDYSYAENNQVLLDYQQNERINFQDKFTTGLKILCMYGTTVSYTGWKYDTRNVISKKLTDVLDDEGNPIYDETTQSNIQKYKPVNSKVTTYDDPEVYFLDLNLFFVDPQAEDIDDARWAGHITYETKSQLQKNHDAGVYNIDWKKISSGGAYNKAKNERMSAVGISNNNNVGFNVEDNLYEVIHYWEDNKHVVIIERAYIAKEEENPYWHKKKPYDKAVYDGIPGEFYGKGIIEPIEPLLHELNTYRNLRIEYSAMVNRRMFKVVKGSGINRKDLQSRPNGVIYVNNMEDIQELLMQNVSPQMFNQEDVVKSDIQDATGAQNVVMGTSARDTATGTMTKDSNATIRFKMIISSVEKKLLGSISMKMIQLNQQYIDVDRVMRITGKKGDSWVKINPDEIQGEFDCFPMGSSVEPLSNKEAYKQRLLQLYQIISTDPLYQQFPQYKIYFIKRLLQSFDIQNVEDMLPTEEEIKAQLAILQQQQQAQSNPQTPNNTGQVPIPMGSQDIPPDLINQLMGMQNTENFSANAQGGLNRSAMEEQGLQPE